MTNIAVIGTGYVGLVVGACLADMGNNVICIDNNKNKLEQLKKGVIPIYEPGLEELVISNVLEKRLTFSDNLEKAIQESSICFIAVGTPQNKSGNADLTDVYKIGEAIGKNLNEYKVIVNKSTVPVGTAEKITEIIKKYSNQSFDIVSNPEFLKQGNAVHDFLYPDRIIIGSNSEKATKIMKEIYTPFFRTSNRTIVMDVKSAEMTKYTANAFLATKISFMNEIANLCEKVGADVNMVRIGIASDERIGDKFLFSGLGFGGSCFPKDISALIKTGEEFNSDMSIIKAVLDINQKQRELFVNKIIKRFGKDLTNKTFGVWGLAFKPKTNDMREAPSVTIINELLKHGAKIKAYDPKAMNDAKEFFADKIIYSTNAYEAIENVDAILLLTEWNEFRFPDFEKIKKLTKIPLIIDGRNQFNKKELLEKGIEYICIGKK